MNTALILGLFFVLIILKVPVAFARYLSSIMLLHSAAGSAQHSRRGRHELTVSYPLLAIAFFIYLPVLS